MRLTELQLKLQENSDARKAIKVRSSLSLLVHVLIRCVCGARVCPVKEAAAGDQGVLDLLSDRAVRASHSSGLFAAVVDG